MSEEEIIEEIENNILNDPFVAFSQDSSFEDVQIKATAIENLIKLYKQQQKEIEILKEKKQDVKDRIEYYLVGNMSLDNFDTRNKELRKLEKMLGE